MNKFLIFLSISISVHLFSFQFLPWGNGIYSHKITVSFPQQNLRLVQVQSLHESPLRENQSITFPSIARKQTALSQIKPVHFQRKKEKDFSQQTPPLLTKPFSQALLKEGARSMALPATMEQPVINQTAPTFPKEDQSKFVSVQQNSGEKSVKSSQGLALQEKQEKIVTLPLFKAKYLHNPFPPYPAISRQLGESGTVILAVFVGENGIPQEIHMKKSSGFNKLDSSAKETVLKWQFVPAKRGGDPIKAWVNVPITFNLSNQEEDDE